MSGNQRPGAVADALEGLAALMELAGGNTFKVRAYERGAHAVRHLGDQFGVRLNDKTLDEVPNIGKSLVAAIEEFTATGQLKLAEQLRAQLPPGLPELAAVAGLGPRKARQVCEELGISTLGELEYAATENRLLHLKGFGPATQTRVLDALRMRHAVAGRCRLDVADRVATELVRTFGALSGVVAVEVVGQVRRRCEVCSEIAVLCSGIDVTALLEHAQRAPGLGNAKAEGTACVTFDSGAGVPGVLHVVSPADFAAASVFLTGPEAHLAALSQRGGAWQLTAQGARQGAGAVAFETEEGVYAGLGLPFIAPELRDSGDEVAQALRGGLPTLIELSDLRGALHNHTTMSDGRDTARAMQQAATALGLQYLGISDHSHSAFYARGLNAEALIAQRPDLLQAAAEGGCQLWHGVESDILPDGGLDYPAEVLAQLDFVVASIHSRHQHGDQQMTQRLVRAVSNPFTDILGHPTGRLLLSRAPYAFDMRAVLDAALQSGCAMELNAQPQRLDLSVEHLRMCKQMGVKVCINADAHNISELEALRFGVSMARRAGLTAADVINTMDAAQMRAWLRNRRQAAR